MRNFPLNAYKGIALIFILFSAGCARQHTIEVQDNTMSLYYRNDEAKVVQFAASADNFQYHSATRKTRGEWLVTIPLYEEFSYFYVVDGTVTLPDCPNTILDDFGGKNCFYQGRM